MSRVSLREVIEIGILEVLGNCLLKKINKRNGYLAMVKQYNGRTDETDGPDDVIRAFRGQYPGILVGPGGTSFDSEGIARTRFKRVITLDFYIGSNHQRSRVSRHTGDVVSKNISHNADPGIYTMIEDVQSILSGNDLGIECVGPLMPVREDLLLQEDGFTIWRVSYETDTDAHVKPRDFGDQPLTATLVRSEDADNDDISFPNYNPVVEAEQDLT